MSDGTLVAPNLLMHLLGNQRIHYEVGCTLVMNADIFGTKAHFAT